MTPGLQTSGSAHKMVMLKQKWYEVELGFTQKCGVLGRNLRVQHNVKWVSF